MRYSFFFGRLLRDFFLLLFGILKVSDRYRQWYFFTLLHITLFLRVCINSNSKSCWRLWHIFKANRPKIAIYRFQPAIYVSAKVYALVLLFYSCSYSVLNGEILPTLHNNWIYYIELVWSFSIFRFFFVYIILFVSFLSTEKKKSLVSWRIFFSLSLFIRCLFCFLVGVFSSV